MQQGRLAGRNEGPNRPSTRLHLAVRLYCTLVYDLAFANSLKSDQKANSGPKSLRLDLSLHPRLSSPLIYAFTALAQDRTAFARRHRAAGQVPRSTSAMTLLYH